MSPWDLLGWIILGYLVGTGVDVFAKWAIPKLFRRKNNQDHPPVTHIYEWRERNDPPRSS